MKFCKSRYLTLILCRKVCYEKRDGEWRQKWAVAQPLVIPYAGTAAGSHDEWTHLINRVSHAYRLRNKPLSPDLPQKQLKEPRLMALRRRRSLFAIAVLLALSLKQREAFPPSIRRGIVFTKERMRYVLPCGHKYRRQAFAYFVVCFENADRWRGSCFALQWWVYREV